MWSVIGMAWNLRGGYCGQVSFGHAAFFGAALTPQGSFTRSWHLAWWGLPLSAIVTS